MRIKLKFNNLNLRKNIESPPFLHYELHYQINAYFAGINLSKRSLKKQTCVAIMVTPKNAEDRFSHPYYSKKTSELE
jgi:hypothetical protein